MAEAIELTGFSREELAAFSLSVWKKLPAAERSELDWETWCSGYTMALIHAQSTVQAAQECEHVATIAELRAELEAARAVCAAAESFCATVQKTEAWYQTRANLAVAVGAWREAQPAAVSGSVHMPQAPLPPPAGTVPFDLVTVSPEGEARAVKLKEQTSGPGDEELICFTASDLRRERERGKSDRLDELRALVRAVASASAIWRKSAEPTPPAADFLWMIFGAFDALPEELKKP